MIEADPLIGYVFDVEDGTAEVTDNTTWADRNYVCVDVTKTDGRRYASVRLREQVARHKAEREGLTEGGVTPA